MSDPKKPVVLLVLDGFGHSETVKYNAIAQANTPVWDNIWQNRPKTLIDTSGMAVGLPDEQMGNSEVGHITLGAGRIVYQSFTRINKAISDGDFFTNPVYVNAIDKAVNAGKAVHVLGLLSTGGVHSHEDHIIAMMQLAASRGAKKLYLHAMLDGRDTPPRSAQSSLEKTEAALKEIGAGKLVSMIGRFFGMDRDKRWDRVQAAYDLIVDGLAIHTAENSVQGLLNAYERGEDDEFVKATAIRAEGEAPVTVEDGDTMIFMNFRPDRARQLTHAFVTDTFDGFARPRFPALADFVMTTEYESSLNATCSCAYPPEDLTQTFGEVVAEHGKTQLRIAETEKYAHVTFFFNGGREDTFPGENRILVPSPKVATYDLQPEMSAPEVTTHLVDAIENCRYDAIICNYANCDMVGHTGIFSAAMKAVEAIDDCLGKVLAAVEKVGGHALITADHGNVEQMFDDESGQAHTQHTTLKVPLVYFGTLNAQLKDNGSLADIAPTLLQLMNLEQPKQMTGQSLLELN